MPAKLPARGPSVGACPSGRIQLRRSARSILLIPPRNTSFRKSDELRSHFTRFAIFRRLTRFASGATSSAERRGMEFAVIAGSSVSRRGPWSPRRYSSQNQLLESPPDEALVGRGTKPSYQFGNRLDNLLALPLNWLKPALFARISVKYCAGPHVDDRFQRGACGL